MAGRRTKKTGTSSKGGGALLHSKKFWIVILAFLLLIAIPQCSGGTKSDTQPTAEASASSSAPESSEPTDTASSSTPAPTDTATTDAAPAPENTAAAASGDAAQSSLATTVLETLPVKGRAPKTGYSRDQFGQAWSDVDHNGCDTRNDILKRDMTNVTFKSGTHDCVVLTGTLDDPYTGTTIQFQRGQRTSTAVQIDHVVALSDAWQTGAQQLSSDQRLQLANDPYNLLAVDGPANEQKSDSDAASWLPSNTAFRCEYVARQIGVKSKYSLWVTQGEKSAMQTVLSSCPTQTVPTDGGVSQGAKVATAAAAQNSTAQASSGSGSGSNSGAAAAQQPAQTADSGSSDVYYGSCSDVRAAGKAPLYAGQPGYRSGLDRDNDGVACEAKK